jgi:hypothetical protein
MTGCLCVGSQHSSGKPTSTGLAHSFNITFVVEEKRYQSNVFFKKLFYDVA